VAGSILNDVKKMCSIAIDDTSFDLDVMVHTNTALSSLNQLGIGPVEGLAIVDASATWSQAIGRDPRLSLAQSYVYLRVRLLLDPPQTSYLIAALEKQVQEMEWRLSVLADTIAFQPALTGFGVGPFGTEPFGA